MNTLKIPPSHNLYYVPSCSCRKICFSIKSMMSRNAVSGEHLSIFAHF